MSLISPEEKEELERRAEAISGDKGKRWNFVELGAALRILRQCLGPVWLESALAQVEPETPTSPPKDFSYLKRKVNINPIPALLRGGIPSNYGQIVKLAHHLS